MQSLHEKCADTYEMKVQVSVARYLRTPPYTAKCKELSFDYMLIILTK